MLKMSARVTGILLSLLLAACGGGGAGDSGTNSAQDNSWLSITPSAVSLTTIEGVSAPFSLYATSSKSIPQTLYPVLIDSGSVIDPQATVITALSQRSYQAQLFTSKALLQGSYSGQLSLWLYTDLQHTSAYPGSPWIIPYHVKVGPVRVAHKLLPEAVGVALSTTPGGDRLTRSIAIKDNLGKLTPWQATSNQAWLQVTAAGTTGTPGTSLTLTADPAGLPSDVVSYATVTLSSSDDTLQPIEKIQVGCWKGSSSAQRADVLAINTGVGGDHLISRICADPVRPYVYLTYGNETIVSNPANVVDCYNIYTATKVASVTLPDDPGYAGSMAIAPDGSALYVVDYYGSNQGLYKILLPEMTVESPKPPQPLFTWNTRITYARPNGVGVILSADGLAIQADTGAQLPSTGVSGQMAITADSSLMFVGSSVLGEGVTSRYQLDFSEFEGGTLVNRLLNSSNSGESGPLAVSGDGSRLYWLTTPTGLPGMVRADPVSLSPLTIFSSYDYCGLRIANDGRLFCAVINHANGKYSLLTLGTDDSLISTQDGVDQSSGTYFPIFQNDFSVSSDSMVVVVNAYGHLHFFPVYP